MADVTGPISSLPGSFHVPQGDCDYHPGRPATRRIQGETDSFGAEMIDLCDECYQKDREEAKNEDYSGNCDWCKSHTDRTIATRDYEEGTHGPVYYVCKECKDRQSAQIAADLAAYDNDYFGDND